MNLRAQDPQDRAEIEEIRRRTDLYALVSESLPLRKAGKSWKGLCPFHREKSPSFHVNATLGLYKCFGCGKSGDVFRWTMEIHGMTFPEALEHLARRAGVARRKRARRDDDPRVAALAALEAAAAWYEKALAARSGEAARAYLAERKITDETVSKFRLGFAPRAGRALVERLTKAEKIDPAVLEAAGLARSNERGRYDFFRGRLLFPIRDVLGRVVGFGGRVLGEGEPKYLNSAENEVFHKSRLLYGLYEGREEISRARTVLLVEGYVDVILLDQAGRGDRRGAGPPAVAPLGTAFTEGQAEELKRRADRVIVMLDADAAGERAARRAIEILLAAGLEVRVARLVGGKDPADLVAAGKTDMIAKAVESAEEAVAYLVGRTVRAGASATERAQGAGEVARILALLPDALVRSAQIRDTASALGVGAEALSKRVDGIRREALRARDATPEKAAFGENPEIVKTARRAPPPASEVRLVRFALADAAVRAYLADEIRAEDFQDPLLGEIYAAALAAAKAEEELAGDLGGRLSAGAFEVLAEITNREEPTDKDLLRPARLIVTRMRKRAAEARLRAATAGQAVDPARWVEEKRKWMEERS